MIAAKATHDEGRRLRKAIRKSGTDTKFAHAERAVLRLICSALRPKPLPPERLVDLLSEPTKGTMTRPKARLWLAHFRTRGCLVFAEADDPRFPSVRARCNALSGLCRFLADKGHLCYIIDVAHPV